MIGSSLNSKRDLGDRTRGQTACFSEISVHWQVLRVSSQVFTIDPVSPVTVDTRVAGGIASELFFVDWDINVEVRRVSIVL